ncbi:MAG: response regulator [Chloroflexi bacterium]|nr:MAG: response regulator [Chloroflexota bacterium]
MPHVLIVEDQESLAEIVSHTLRQIDISSTICLNGRDALIYMENNPLPDLIILDISMPGMSGWEFLDVIKQYEETKLIPVIVTTAHGDAANRLVGKLREVDRYITKPYKPQDIQEAVKSTLLK